MKIKIKQTVEKEVMFLQVRAGVRYWEDSTVNDVVDEDGNLIPCRDGEDWCPKIFLATGRIVNWTEGVRADIHYKVCDDGDYTLLDVHGAVVLTQEGYVPGILCPEENGYGDYIIMKVNEKGEIDNWNPDLSCFGEDEE